MHVYIWEYADHVSESYHSSGGLVAVALDIGEARAMIARSCPARCSALTADPDVTYDLAGDSWVSYEKYLHVFRDEGCC